MQCTKCNKQDRSMDTGRRGAVCISQCSLLYYSVVLFLCETLLTVQSLDESVILNVLKCIIQIWAREWTTEESLWMWRCSTCYMGWATSTGSAVCYVPATLLEALLYISTGWNFTSGVKDTIWSAVLWFRPNIWEWIPLSFFWVPFFMQNWSTAWCNACNPEEPERQLPQDEL